MDAIQYLNACMCVCGNLKKSGQSACGKCFYELPIEERGDNIEVARKLLEAHIEPFELERAPSTVEPPMTVESTTGEQLTLFMRGSDWKLGHQDLFDVDDLENNS